MVEKSTPKEKKRKTAQLDYIDLLASSLAEHEKKLDGLIERLGNVSENLIKEAQKPQETLIYIRLRLNCSTEELKMILESLKDDAGAATPKVLGIPEEFEEGEPS